MAYQYGNTPAYYGQGTHSGSPMTENMTSEQKEALKTRRNHGFRKLRTHGLVGILLAVMAIAAGIAVIAVAKDNIAFPTFNPGPIIVGVIILFAGLLGWRAAQRGLDEVEQDKPSSGVKCGIIGHFVICVTCISIACVAAVFSLLAAGVCFDPDDVITNKKGGGKVNLSEACEPNKTGNAVTGLISGLVCLLIALWSIFGTCFLCCFGRSFGFEDKRRRRREIMLEQRVAQLERERAGPQPPPYYADTHKY